MRIVSLNEFSDGTTRFCIAATHELLLLEYLASLEEGEFAIDSYPIGGYNTVIDSLQVRRPFVSLEGEKFYNRVASSVLRMVGLEEMVTRNDDEFVALSLRLIRDEGYRSKLAERIASLNLQRLLFSPQSPQYFKRAID